MSPDGELPRSRLAVFNAKFAVLVFWTTLVAGPVALLVAGFILLNRRQVLLGAFLLTSAAALTWFHVIRWRHVSPHVKQWPRD